MVNNLKNFLSFTVELKVGTIILILVFFIVTICILLAFIKYKQNGILHNIGVFVKNKFKKSPVNCIVWIIVGALLLILFGSSILGITLGSEVLNTVLNFFVSFIFAIYLANYSAGITFKEKQKEAAIISYRHSINIKNKIEYSLEIIEIIVLSMSRYKMNACNNGTCSAISQINRIKDTLINIKADSDNNINDWGDILTEELLKVDEILDLECDVDEYRDDLREGFLDDKEYQSIHNKLNELQTELKEKKDSLSPLAKNMCLLNSTTYNELFGEHVKREKNKLKGYDLQESRRDEMAGFANTYSDYIIKDEEVMNN